MMLKTAQIKFINEELNLLQDRKRVIEKMINDTINKIKTKVENIVNEKFTEFEEGDKVLVTYTDGKDDITRVLAYHKPTKIKHLNGTSECDYEIRFHTFNNDGSECKYDCLSMNHVVVTDIKTMVKL